MYAVVYEAVSLAVSFLVSMISRDYNCLILAVSVTISSFVCVDIGTYMRLGLLLGSAKGCPGSTCRWIDR